MPVIVSAVLLSAMFSPFVFLSPIPFILLGMALWGIGQVTQDMLLSALIAGVLPGGGGISPTADAVATDHVRLRTSQRMKKPAKGSRDL